MTMRESSEGQAASNQCASRVESSAGSETCKLQVPLWRRFFKRIWLLRRGYRWATEVWSDLRLLILTATGYIPSHEFRKIVYSAFGVRIHPTSSLHWRARFFCPEGLLVGENCTLGNDGFYDARGGVTIGNCVNIAAEVRIYTRQHDIDSPDFAECGGPVIIEDYVYIGTRVTILPGVSLGEGCVVATGAVVTKNVPPYTLVGGVPAKAIRQRSQHLTYKLGYAKRFQ